MYHGPRPLHYVPSLPQCKNHIDLSRMLLHLSRIRATFVEHESSMSLSCLGVDQFDKTLGGVHLHCWKFPQ
jgi:hypothetical protein